MNTRETPKRRYRMLQRALQQEETRRRIVDAAVSLHTSLGPARTSVKAIAQAAGVERLTVYRHFPDADALYRACTARSRALWPPPQVAKWQAVPVPQARLRGALVETYRHYEARCDGLTVIQRDAHALPAWLQDALRRERREMLDVLMRGWPPRARRLRRAVLAHALDFQTFRSLVKIQGLSIDEAVGVMLRLVRGVGKSRDG